MTDPHPPADLLGLVRRANAEWVSILDALEDLVVLETPDGRVARCNRAAAIVMQEDVRLAIGKPLTDLLWRPDEAPLGNERKARVLIRNSDDLYEHTSYALPDGNRVHLLTNINDRRKLEAVAEGINVSDNLTFMVSGIRHELGNPLNSVKMALSVLTERLPSLRMNDIIMYLERMGEQVQRMEYLLQLLRSFSASEVVTPVPVDLTLAVHEFLRLSQLDLERRGVVFVVNSAPLPLIVGEPRAMQQVLSNIVANAVDAKKPDTPLQITITSTVRGKRVVLSVSDNGRGMNSGTQSMLFRPFATSKPHGTGLGLFIVRRLLTTLGATITIASKSDVGTTVDLSFAIA